MSAKFQDSLRQAYASAIGRPRRELVTPALILDLDAARRNIATMAERMSRLKARLRPHVKVQKSAELAKLQIAAGAIGVCTATVWEAIVMSRAGIKDVLIANQTGGREKLRALAEAAREGRLTATVDNAANVTELAAALRIAGSRLEVVIEIDVGMGRGGVRSVEEAVALARHVAGFPELRFRGVEGYEGHCMLEPDRALRLQKARAAMDHVGTVVERLAAAGFPCEVVSAGGTGTYDITGADARVTEIQAGSYVFMDNFHGSLVPGFSPALTVLGTVTIQHGNTIVLDAGRKSVGIDFVLPTMVDYPAYQARYFAEEHALFDVDERCPLKLGDTMELIPGYAPTTVNLYDVYHVVEKGVVAEVWPIIPRGPGHGGLLAP
ncbi:MAG: DSD1 family PLP-dependent enzyme [Verrucomicrobiota bacterium]|jgi:D-serine deaminase-like pyridoxal phosphate-dependent protein